MEKQGFDTLETFIRRLLEADPFLYSALLLFAAAIGSLILTWSERVQGQAQTPENHIAWVAETLKQMQEVKPGMTRNDLLKVFKTEGGLSTGLNRTYVSRACPYFKVDVEFNAVGRPNRNPDGRVTLLEDGRDIIVKISRPYLAFMVLD